MKANVTNHVGKFTKRVFSEKDKAMYKVVMKAGGIVKKEAQRGAKSRKIASSLIVIGKNPVSGPEAHVGYKYGSRGWYGKFLESGTEEHEIRPKKVGGVLAFAQIDGQAEFTTKRGKTKRLNYYRTKKGYTLSADEAKIYFKKVEHPGMEKEPLLVPALERKKPEIIDVIGGGVRNINVQGGYLIQ